MFKKGSDRRGWRIMIKNLEIMIFSCIGAMIITVIVGLHLGIDVIEVLFVFAGVMIIGAGINLLSDIFKYKKLVSKSRQGK